MRYLNDVFQQLYAWFGQKWRFLKQPFNHLKHLLTSGLARQYIIWTFLFGSSITAVITVAEIFWFHNSSVSRVEDELIKITDVFAGPLGRATWKFNSPQIEEILNGVVNSTSATFAKLESDTLNISSGQVPPAAKLSHTVTIAYHYEGEQKQLGTFSVMVDSRSIIKATISFGVIQIASNFFKACLVILFSFFVFRTLVNRHLIYIAQRTKNSNLLQSDLRPYHLSRNTFAYKRGDELDTVTKALNDMSVEIHHQFEKLETLSEQRQHEFVTLGMILHALNFYVSFFKPDGTKLFVTALESHFDDDIASLLSRPAISQQKALHFAQTQGFEVRPLPESRSNKLTGHGPEQILYRLELENAAGKVWLMSGVRLRDESVAVLFADNTDITTLQRRLDRAHKLEALGTLTSSVMHEFNNLLAVIQGNVEILKFKQLTKPGGENHLDALTGAVDQG